MTTKIKVNSKGPVRIEGDFELLDGNGQPFDLNGRTVISLCRCGQTQNQPFCDGSHGKCGFASEVTACQLPPPKAKSV